MIVFISDIHLTDGTSGETINAGAFEKFAMYVRDMAKKAEAKNLEIVLLGDIFDVIRSDYWLKGNIRPWSKESDGFQGKGLKDYAEEIVKRICSNPENKKSIGHLNTLKENMIGEDKIPVSFTYLIGNHDWLINRYSTTRGMIAQFIGMDNPAQYRGDTIKFPTECYREEYNVFARHGDIYDAFNYDGNRDASSLGDAIVIDLINRFPKAVEIEFQNKGIKDDQLITQLKEIDNVRPLVDIPSWIMGVCRRTVSPKAAEEVKKVWNNLVDQFLAIDFIKKHDTWNPFDIVDALQLGLRISKYSSLEDIANLPLKQFQSKADDYRDEAYNEAYMKNNKAEFVLYGHTHGHTIEPLDVVQTNGAPLQKTYINTGTWRKVHVRTAFDKKSLEFMNWHVMTFVAFYLESERKDKRFEIWNGALG